MASTAPTTNSNEQEQLREYLLGEREEMAREDLISKFKSYSILIGVCCGVFVQLSTLGANFLLVAMWGDDAVATRNQNEAMVFSLVWSFFTSCMALLILALLRALVNSVLDANTDDDEEGSLERETLMMTIEVRYVVGALTGVCFAWTCTDLLLGMQSLAIYSLATLIVALFWSKAMIWCFSPKNINPSHESEKGAYMV